MDEAREVKCPICRIPFHINEYLDAGDILACPMCSTDLEITNLNPPRVREVVENDGYSYLYDDEEEEQ